MDVTGDSGHNYGRYSPGSRSWGTETADRGRSGVYLLGQGHGGGTPTGRAPALADGDRSAAPRSRPPEPILRVINDLAPCARARSACATITTCPTRNPRSELRFQASSAGYLTGSQAFMCGLLRVFARYARMRPYFVRMAAAVELRARGRAVRCQTFDAQPRLNAGAWTF
jgi:hypothetical protein